MKNSRNQKQDWKAAAKSEEDRRALTRAEQERKEAFEKRKAELEEQGWHAEDLTIGLIYANVMALLLGFPIVAAMAVIYIWRLNHLKAEPFLQLGSISAGLLFIALFVLSIFVHELIHGITWSLFAKDGWKSVSFGFIAKYLTPYCTCREPLRKSQYIIGAAMPTILLGILLGAAAIAAGSNLLFLLSEIMIFTGGGDLTIILKLLQHKPSGTEAIYIDHPYQAGFVVFTR